MKICNVAGVPIADVSEQEKSPGEADGVVRCYQDEDIASIKLGSGHYEFSYRYG
jgi:hypothetical protein